MPEWSPLAILPNLTVEEPLDGGSIALVSGYDPRLTLFNSVHSQFPELLSRFTNCFGVPLRPAVLIGRQRIVDGQMRPRAIVSYRDMVSMSVVPYARSAHIVYQGLPRIMYSNWFWLHPWMLSKDNIHISASTPAMLSLHSVDKFQGQSSPELSHLPLDWIDRPLFEALLLRWNQHYLGRRAQTWEDRALFRSLNMANQAASLPGGTDTTIFDLGRMIALWVSAFEILAHPGTSKSDVIKVRALLNRVDYLDRSFCKRRYIVHRSRSGATTRDTYPCWLYTKLYETRNNFLHGNPLSRRPIDTQGGSASLFMLAAPLYRLALTAFLGGVPELPQNVNMDVEIDTAVSRLLDLQEYQGVIERAILRARK